MRGKGLMIGIEFAKDKQTKEPARELQSQVMHRRFENGLLTLGCGRSTARFIPPPMIGKDLADEGLEIFEHVLTGVEKE